MTEDDMTAQERYHLKMAKVYEAHVDHHRQMAAQFINSRKELKQKKDKTRSTRMTKQILDKLMLR
jgi:hypothetical protein